MQALPENLNVFLGNPKVDLCQMLFLILLFGVKQYNGFYVTEKSYYFVFKLFKSIHGFEWVNLLKTQVHVGLRHNLCLSQRRNLRSFQ